MNKLDLSKIPDAKADFIDLPSWWALDGKKTFTPKKGRSAGVPTDVLIFRKQDGDEIALFADQLRQEGNKLLVSERHYKAQLERAAAWKAQLAGSVPQ